MRAIQVSEFGGPEVLVPAVVADPVANHDELLVRVTGAGVNYADTHQAENTYLSGSTLPFVPGGEVVGEVVDPGGVPRRVCGFAWRPIAGISRSQASRSMERPTSNANRA